MTAISGKVWKFGCNIDTDTIIPARHLVLPLAEMKTKAMSPIDPSFAAGVRNGDIIVAGRNFGCGSSREQAPAVLKALGIKAVVAGGFARIFFRNAINLGLPVIECGDMAKFVRNGDTITIEPGTGDLHILDNGRRFSSKPLPPFLWRIAAAGGLIPYLSRKVSQTTGS